MGSIKAVITLLAWILIASGAAICSRNKVSWGCRLTKNDLLECGDIQIILNYGSINSTKPISAVVQSRNKGAIATESMNGTCKFSDGKKVRAMRMRCAIVSESEHLTIEDLESCRCICLMPIAIPKKVKKDVRTSMPKNTAPKSYKIPEILIGFLPDSNETVVKLTISGSNKEIVADRYYIRLLYLVQGKDCDKGGTKVFNEVFPPEHLQEEIWIINFRQNTTQGNYCIKVTPYGSSTPTWSYQFEIPEALPNTSLHTLKVTPEEEVSNAAVTLGLIPGLVLFVCLSGFVYAKYIRNKILIPSESEGQSSTEESVPDLKEQTVLLIHDNQHQYHNKTTQLLTDFMKKYFKCKIYYAEECEKEIRINRPAWMYNRMIKCDKIVIVNNYETFCRQENFLNEDKIESITPDDPPFFYEMFDYFLGMIMNQPDYWNNYEKIINLKFSYTKSKHVLKFIQPDLHFNIPSELKQFFEHFHSSSSDDSLINWRQVNIEKVANWKNCEILRNLTEEISTLTNVPQNSSCDSLATQTTEMTCLINSSTDLNNPSVSSEIRVEIPLDEVLPESR